jgi:DNA-binding SARP family transcriptional activator/tetratricopeptide (TPR) repeat protein
MIHTAALGGVRIRLLGPVAVAGDDAWQPVNGRRRSAVLAALALQPSEAVSTDRLVDIVWGDRAPRTAGDTLRNHVSYLRGMLPAGATIVTRSAGYAIDLDARGTDVQAAEHLIKDASRAIDTRQRESRLQQAIALWQGPALADLTELTWFGEHAQRLNRLQLDTRRLLIDARLELGHHHELVAELENLSREHWLDEPLHGQLMVALSRSGRQADALATYQRLRDALDEELGVLPGATIRDLHAAILRQDTTVAPPDAPVVGTSTGTLTAPYPVPAQLPPAIVTFAGRDREATSLNDILDRTPKDTGPVVVSICGTAGVGKTALALHWTHRIKQEFPDGQLYVDLRGFDPGGRSMDPAEAVRGFLDALGVPHHRIPESPQAQVNLYRSMLAGKRMLILADNARDEHQVRPLLPGAPGCLVIVTSRNQLTGLIAASGAHPLTLDLPSVAEARQILARRLGSQRIRDEPEAVDDIIAHCARLPLALAIAAAPAALAPTVPLVDLAAQLREAVTTLSSFYAADPDTNIGAVFSWSYQTLSDPAARLFRLLGPCPAPDVTLPAAASLTGLPPADARPLLLELTRAHLISQTSPGRYGFHNLLRAYAIEQTQRHDSVEEQSAARHRFLDHYLHTAHTATLVLRPARDPITVSAPAPGVTLQPLADLDAALSWFQAEHPVLLATMARAADGFDHHTWQLAWTVMNYLTIRGYWRDNELAQQAGLAAADRLGDPTAQAYAHRCLAKAYGELGRPADAQAHNEIALTLFDKAGNVIETATTHLNLGHFAGREGDIHRALIHAEKAHRAYESVGSTRGQAWAANAIGWYHGQLGNHAKGLPYCQEALEVLVNIDDPDGAASTWDSLGALHFGIGDSAQGEHCYLQAIMLYHRLDDRYNEADSYVNLVKGYIQTGNHDAARCATQQAMAIINDLEPDAAAEVRARLGPTLGSR